MWSKLDGVSKVFRGPVNVITPAEVATKRTWSILEVKDNVGTGEEEAKVKQKE